jgi:hypothetical protein
MSKSSGVRNINPEKVPPSGAAVSLLYAIKTLASAVEDIEND